MSTLRRHAITLIPGDGVGPEVARAAQRILDAAAARAGVAFDWEEAEAGASVFIKGDQTGVPQATRDSIDRTRVALKGPLETPVGFGEKSANVTLRKLFETYANVRPARELPGIPSRYKGEGVDMVIGYVSSGDCLAVAPVAEEMKRLLVLFDCGSPRCIQRSALRRLQRRVLPHRRNPVRLDPDFWRGSNSQCLTDSIHNGKGHRRNGRK